MIEEGKIRDIGNALRTMANIQFLLFCLWDCFLQPAIWRLKERKGSRKTWFVWEKYFFAQFNLRKFSVYFKSNK